tara:strand:+ start:7889 stop:8119 length:231 start_codon:yes stop_codon:yes gene_type:complete
LFDVGPVAEHEDEVVIVDAAITVDVSPSRLLRLGRVSAPIVEEDDQLRAADDTVSVVINTFEGDLSGSASNTKASQ